MAQAPQSKKVVFQTGGAKGIGLEVCVALAKEGFTVYATSRSEKSIGSAKERCDKEGVTVNFLEMDICSVESVQKAVSAIVAQEKRIDVLINNAGVTPPMNSVENTPLDQARWCMEVNFIGVIIAAQAVVPQMREQKSGLIINISSGLAGFGAPFNGVYCASKSALDRLSESMWFELKEFGIDVKVVNPPAVKTTFLDTMFGEEAMKEVRAKIDPSYTKFEVLYQNWSGASLQTGITPEEVASCLVKLCKGEGQDFHEYPTEGAKQFHGTFCKDTTYKNITDYGSYLLIDHSQAQTQ